MSIAFDAVVGGLQTIFGSHNILFLLYLIMNMLDLVAGALAAYSKSSFSFRELTKGLARKLGYWIMIATAFIVAIGLKSVGGDINVDLSFIVILGWIVLATLLVNEARSILQKLVDLGVNVPPVLELMLKKAESELDNKYAGTMVINTTDPAKDVFRLELDCDPGELIDKDEIRFKIKNEAS